jgi:hypothetical protein
MRSSNFQMQSVNPVSIAGVTLRVELGQYLKTVHACRLCRHIQRETVSGPPGLAVAARRGQGRCAERDN